MKKFIVITSLSLFFIPLHAETIYIIPPSQEYYYDEYSLYQPDNGPMRGPNSIEGHKSYKERQRSFLP